MIKYSYTTVDEKLKQKIINENLSENDLEIIKDIILMDYEEYYKVMKKYKFFGVTAIASFLISIIMVLLISVLPFSNGSPQAKMYVFAIIGVFLLFIVNVMIAAYQAIKLSKFMHVKHALNLMYKHYPNTIETYGLKK